MGESKLIKSLDLNVSNNENDNQKLRLVFEKCNGVSVSVPKYRLVETSGVVRSMVEDGDDIQTIKIPCDCNLSTIRIIKWYLNLKADPDVNFADIKIYLNNTNIELYKDLQPTDFVGNLLFNYFPDEQLDRDKNILTSNLDGLYEVINFLGMVNKKILEGKYDDKLPMDSCGFLLESYFISIYFKNWKGNIKKQDRRHLDEYLGGSPDRNFYWKLIMTQIFSRMTFTQYYRYIGGYTQNFSFTKNGVYALKLVDMTCTNITVPCTVLSISPYTKPPNNYLGLILDKNKSITEVKVGFITDGYIRKYGDDTYDIVMPENSNLFDMSNKKIRKYYSSYVFDMVPQSVDTYYNMGRKLDMNIAKVSKRIVFVEPCYILKKNVVKLCDLGVELKGEIFITQSIRSERFKRDFNYF